MSIQMLLLIIGFLLVIVAAIMSLLDDRLTKPARSLFYFGVGITFLGAFIIK